VETLGERGGGGGSEEEEGEGKQIA
jgi:hypothetical protein